MTAEGWNGKSIRQHVEDIETEAAGAVEIAQALEERIDSLEERIDSLEERIDSLEERIDSLEERINSLRLEHLNTLDLVALAPPAPKGAKK